MAAVALSFRRLDESWRSAGITCILFHPCCQRRLTASHTPSASNFYRRRKRGVVHESPGDQFEITAFEIARPFAPGLTTVFHHPTSAEISLARKHRPDQPQAAVDARSALRKHADPALTLELSRNENQPPIKLIVRAGWTNSASLML